MGFTLTRKNYHSQEANAAFMSVHQFQDWEQCARRTAAVLAGEHERPFGDALLFGSYVDCAITEPEQMEDFKAENPGLFKKDGSLYAKFVQADECVERLRRDPLAWRMLTKEGSKAQVVITGDIGGCPWKGLVDVLHPEKRIFVDLKTTRTLADVWDKAARKWTPWYERYWQQVAVYSELCRQQYGGDWTGVLVAVSKQDPPAVRGVVFDGPASIRERLSWELGYIADNMQRIWGMKEGTVPREACLQFDDCEYCRGNAKFDLETAKA